MPTTGIKLRASTTHACGFDANSFKCCDNAGGAIGRGAAEALLSGGFVTSASLCCREARRVHEVAVDMIDKLAVLLGFRFYFLPSRIGLELGPVLFRVRATGML